MKIVREDFGIRLTCMVGRDRAGIDHINRRRLAKRRRARFLARLPLLARVRALWCAVPAVAAVRVVADGKWRGIGQ